MNYREALAYVDSLKKYGSVLGTDNLRRLCERLGHPEKKCRFIHVAGTNGKGSTAAYIAHILMAAGYKVGRYISPAISDYRERFQVGTRMITQKDMCGYVERLKQVCEELTLAGYPYPAPLDVETALGFLYFAEKHCDYVVLAADMGGAAAATNGIPAPVACVWTSISLDPMQFPGESLAEIAVVQAGIAKPGALYISCKQEPEVEAVLRKRVLQVQSVPALQQESRAELLDATHNGCTYGIENIGNALHEEYNGGLHIADVAVVSGIRYGLTTQQFNYKGLSKLKIHLAGTHQITNAALAVETVLQLRNGGLADISDQAIYRGLEETKWPGRFEVLGTKPLFVVDGAHNEDAARKLVSSIETYFAGKRLIYIMGVLQNIEYEKMLEISARYAEHILTITPPDNPRALDALELAEAAGRYHPQVTNLSSLEEAVEIAHLLADKDGVILCFGSLSYLGALKKVYEKYAG